MFQIGITQRSSGAFTHGSEPGFLRRIRRTAPAGVQRRRHAGHFPNFERRLDRPSALRNRGLLSQQAADGRAQRHLQTPTDHRQRAVRLWPGRGCALFSGAHERAGDLAPLVQASPRRDVGGHLRGDQLRPSRVERRAQALRPARRPELPGRGGGHRNLRARGRAHGDGSGGVPVRAGRDHPVFDHGCQARRAQPLRRRDHHPRLSAGRRAVAGRLHQQHHHADAGAQPPGDRAQV